VWSDIQFQLQMRNAKKIYRLKGGATFRGQGREQFTGVKKRIFSGIGVKSGLKGGRGTGWGSKDGRGKRVEKTLLSGRTGSKRTGSSTGGPIQERN